MAKFTIDEGKLDDLKGKVIIVTGGSSGIGLATVELLLEHGAWVVQGDLNPPPATANQAVIYKRTDVRSWNDLKSLFKEALTRYGRVDHVHANAGLVGLTTYLTDEFDDEGELKEPNHIAVEVMFTGFLNTVKLAIFHMKTQESGGSIVMTASASSFQRFQSLEYTAVKHGVLGLMRALSSQLYPHQPIRVNCIAPSWTSTGIVIEDIAKAAGVPVQPARFAALSSAILMADSTRNQQLIYSDMGEFWELEEDLLKEARRILPRKTTEAEDMHKLLAIMKEQGVRV